MTTAERFHNLFPGSDRKHLDCDPTRQKFDPAKKKVEIGDQGAQSPGGVSLQDWENHLAGRRRVGVAPNLEPDGSTCIFGNLDVDTPKEACEIAAKLATRQIPALVWRSKSPGHIRIGLFAKSPVTCTAMKARLEDIRRYLGLDPETEVFPRQEILADGKFGQPVFFPYFKMIGGTEVCVRPDNTVMTAEEFLDAAEAIAEEPGFFEQPMNLPTQAVEPVAEASPKAKKEGRNNLLAQLAGGMRRAGMSVPEIRAALNVARVERFPRDPLPMKEIEDTILKSARTWEQGRIACAEPEELDNGEDLNNADLPPMEWLVSNLIPGCGVAVMVARPKMGKSFLSLQAALAVANGTKFLGQFDTGEPRRVLYFGLEDSRRRIKTRLTMTHSDAVARRNIDFLYKLRFDVDGFIALESKLDAAVNSGRPFRLVVIDTFLNAVLGRSGKMDPVRADYQEMRLLSQIAQKYNLGILLVHHSRKTVRGEDIGSLDQMLGTTGMSAAADSIIILNRKPANDEHEEERTMFVTGKDVDLPDALEMEFNPAEGGWSLLGVASHLHASKAKQEIFDLLKDKPEGMTPADIAKALGKKQDSIRQMLKRMRDQDEVVKDPDEKYRVPKLKQDRLPFTTGTLPVSPEPPQNTFYEAELVREAA